MVMFFFGISLLLSKNIRDIILYIITEHLLFREKKNHQINHDYIIKKVYFPPFLTCL